MTNQREDYQIRDNLQTAIADIPDSYRGTKVRFSKYDDALVWLSKYNLVSVSYADNPIDPASSNYAWVGLIWGTERDPYVDAGLFWIEDAPFEDVNSGKAKIIGASGLREHWKHLAGRHDQKVHGRLRSSKLRQSIQSLIGIRDSEYSYKRDAKLAIRKGEATFTRAIEGALQDLSAQDWKAGLSDEAKSQLGDNTIASSISYLRSKGMSGDAQKIEDLVLDTSISRLSTFGDGKNKLSSDILDGVEPARKATDWLKSTISTTASPANLSIVAGDRSSCGPESLNLASHASNIGQSLVHEYGHWLDYSDKNTYNATTSFLKSRAGPVVKLRSYEGSDVEEVYSDTFVTPYVGKVYTHGANEVLSIGLQHLYAAPSRFLKTDPDHFFLTLSQISSYQRVGKSEVSSPSGKEDVEKAWKDAGDYFKSKEYKGLNLSDSTVRLAKELDYNLPAILLHLSQSYLTSDSADYDVLLWEALVEVLSSSGISPDSYHLDLLIYNFNSPAGQQYLKHLSGE